MNSGCKMEDTLNQAIEQFENAEDEFEAYSVLGEIRKLAELGYPPAQYSTGYLLWMNPGLTDDDEKAYEEASRWFKKASDSGIPEACRYLGQMYADGSVVEKNIGEAIRLLTIAAKEGMPFAQSRLARIYYYGDCVPEDKEKAYMWYSLAAEQGEGEAQYILGKMFFEGNPVPKDWDKALDLLQCARLKGYTGGYKMINEIEKNKKNRSIT